MSAFPIDAGLEGFRFTREHPRAIALWGALSFAGWVAGRIILITSGAEAAVAGLPTVAPTDPAGVEAVFAALPAIAPGLALHFALSLALFAVLACSAFRAMLRERGPATLRFGPDELRMMALMVALSLVNVAVLFGVSGVTGFLTLIVGGPASPAGAAVFALGQIADVALQAFVMVRLALATPMSVAERRWSLAESWKRAHGRFWPLLGALVVAALLYLLVVFLVSQLFGNLAQMLNMALGGKPPTAGLGQLTHPGLLLSQVGLALAFALGVPILAGPLAYAYRAFSPARAAGAAQPA